MIELEGRRYYETRDLEEIFGRARPTIWMWRRDGVLPKPMKPFGQQGRCLWPKDQIDNLDEE